MSPIHGTAPPGPELPASLAVIAPFAWRSLVFSLIAALLVLVPTFYMFEVYDRVVNSRNVMTLAVLTALVLGVYVVMETLEWAGSEGMREAGRAWDQRLAPRVFDAVFITQLRRPGPPSLQPLHDLRALRDFLVNPLVPAVLGAPVALVFAAILFALSPLLGWTAVLGAVAQASLAWMAERGSAPGIQAANRAAQSAQQQADACWRNAEAVQAMGMLGPLHRRWAGSQKEMLAHQARASHAAGGFHAASKGVQQAVTSGLLGLGAWLLLEDRLPGGAGMLIVGSVLGGRLLAPLVLAVSQWRTVVQARIAWNRLGALLQQTPAPPQGMALPAPRGPLIVEGVVASAPGSSSPILRGVGLALLPGEFLAVVGPSGSGKSTLARVVIGLWPTLQGKVRLDGADVHLWNKSELGVHLGYLPQEVELLDGSIADNISRFGLADGPSVEQAARQVGLHDWIAGLPQGYDTSVGPGGAALSGGQRQRVGLARALVGQPALVVLDEPNSSLDEAGDQALLDAITHLKASGSIVIAITHRSNILPLADKLLLLREGAVQAFGPRDDVLAQLKAGARPAAQRGATAPLSGPLARPRPAA